MRALAPVLVAAASLSACVTSAGWSTSWSTSSSSGGASGSQDAKLTELFGKLTWRHALSVSDGSEAVQLIDGAGVDAGLLQRTSSPDHDWLPGWPYGLEGYALATTFVQAAVNRTWQPQCYADYAEYRRQWKAIDATYRPRLDALLATRNYYDRALGLLRLDAEVAQAARDQHATLSDGHPTAYVGLTHEVRAALVATYRDAGRGYVIADHVRAWARYKDEVADRSIGAATVGRPWSRDDGAERDLFCLYGEQLGTQRTPAMPRLISDEPGRHPDWQEPARRARALALLQAAATADKAAFALDASRPPVMTMTDDPRRGVLVDLYPRDVTAVRRQGTHVTLTLSSESSQLHWGNCRRTGGIDRIRDDGSVVAHETCDGSSTTFVSVVTVTLDDVPASITFTKGDNVSLYGTVAKDREQTRGNTTRRDVLLTGAHIGYILGPDAKTRLTLMAPPDLGAR
jgi:hypothetical protein